MAKLQAPPYDIEEVFLRWWDWWELINFIGHHESKRVFQSKPIISGFLGEVGLNRLKSGLVQPFHIRFRTLAAVTVDGIKPNCQRDFPTGEVTMVQPRTNADDD